MSETFNLRVIGRIYNDYKEKFGIPRQSGLAKSLISKIEFEKEFSNPEYFKGLSEFSHIWIIWQFSETVGKETAPTVRPPKLGGNKRTGVFATRSPFRPNNIGLSSVKIEKIDINDKKGVTIYVSGADIMNGTPIYDIKPYLPYTDIHNDASNGFALTDKAEKLKVKCSKDILEKIPKQSVDALFETLMLDPRPSYQNDGRIYGMSFGEFQVKFKVIKNTVEITDIL